MTEYEIKPCKDGFKLVPVEGYYAAIKLLAKVKDTGNGYIFRIPSLSYCEQDNYICMDYAEALYIRDLLIHFDNNKT